MEAVYNFTGRYGSSLLSKSCANLEVRLPDNSSIESAHVWSTHNPQRVQQAGKASLSNRLRFRNAQKRGYLPSQGLHNSRFLQQIVSRTKTREKMAPCDRSKCPEQFSACSYVQNGDCRDYQKLGHKRGMASFHKSVGCVLSRSHTSGFSTLASFPCRQTNIPIQSSAFRVSDGTPRVHADCKRSKTRSSVPRNSSSPIPGRLVIKSKYKTPVSAPHKRTHPCGATTGFCDKL